MTLWSLCAFAASTVRSSVLRFSLTLPWLIRPRTRTRSSKLCKPRTPLHRARLLHAGSAMTLSLHADFATKLHASTLQSSHGTVSIQAVRHSLCIDAHCAAPTVASDTFAIGHATTSPRTAINADLLCAETGGAPKSAQLWLIRKTTPGAAIHAHWTLHIGTVRKGNTSVNSTTRHMKL